MQSPAATSRPSSAQSDWEAAATTSQPCSTACRCHLSRPCAQGGGVFLERRTHSQVGPSAQDSTRIDMSSMVQLQPLRPPDPSRLGAALSSPNSSGSFPSGSSSKSRPRVTSARKKMERVAHERAPGLATMVAGHHHRPKNTTKRYSASEYQHLVPDESGELHDPEYEGIKIVRRPSVSTVASTDTPSEASVSHPPQSGPSYQRYPNASYNTAVPPQNKHLQGLAAPLRTTPKRPSSVLTSQLSEPSVAETRGSVRTYGEGGVTYLAPSITMPAVSSRDSISGSGRAVSSGSYNPVSCAIPVMAYA